jgi:hypothetical protein
METESARLILRASGVQHVATRRVVERELVVDPRDRTHGAQARFDALASDALVDVVGIDSLEELFVDFCFEIDDGEAATLAYAKHAGGVAVLDDEAARRVAMQASIDVAWTIDLILDNQAVREAGQAMIATALYDALRFGRMRIPRNRVAEVIGLVGVERARDCPSIPRSLIR